MRLTLPTQPSRLPVLLLAAGLIALAAALLVAVGPAAAQDGSPLHPVFPLLDAAGENVLESGSPVSTLQTCGACHDAEFITAHNAHAGVLTGAVTAPAGEAVMVDTETGAVIALDEAAGEVELNCFLCHFAGVDNDSRLAALAAGQAEWANTASLAGAGLAEPAGSGFTWNASAFDADGNLLPENVGIHDPVVENCGQCHGVATMDAVTPLVLDECGTEQRTTLLTGQVFSPQRIADSGLNIAGKNELSRTWDVHAERIVGCTDCHYALNNPAYTAPAAAERPEHLLFDPRRLDPGEYLTRPLHELARSEADPSTANACIDCHEVQTTHSWLPYATRHIEVVACESCHVPRLEAPARQSVDWTVLTAAGGPQATCRGQVTDENGRVLITGYEPALLTHEGADGEPTLAPYNLVASWYWAAGDGEPVSLADLQAAYFDGGSYHAEILAAFDADASGAIEEAELVIDSDGKAAAVAARLESLGLADPHIEAVVDAYPINHGVTHGEWATRECTTCHEDDSQLVAPVVLASSPPGGVVPAFDANPANPNGEIVVAADGSVQFAPATRGEAGNVYVFGHSRSKVIDWIGILLFLGTLAGVTAHGGLRFFAARRMAAQEPQLRQIYMYSVYERLWHWLQTAVILLLIFTGLIIHRPDLFGIFSFRYVVVVHNILAAVLVVNAALALFYHLASGEIRQFLPRPYGFFDQAIVQAKFYLMGIFRGDEHPFEKSPQRKFNPLQQVTYFGLLNVLLPLQVLTGLLMWGAQHWTQVTAQLGGLPFLAPVHTLVSWLLASFVVAHVYLTTTGHEPLAGIRGMIMGWDEVEVHAGAK